METITLFYLSIGVCLFLLILLANSYRVYNALKKSFKLKNITLVTTKSELIKAEKRLEQYEKTNVEQIKKINDLYAELDAYATKISEYELENINLKDELDDKVVFINALNERLQKAEANAEEYFNRWNDLKEDNRLLADKRDELETRLSRKGLGKKGRKKKEQHIGGGEYFANNSDNTISIGIDLAKENSYFSQITEVPFEEQKYVEITSEEQLREYNGCKFEADMFIDQIESHIAGVVFNKDATTLILHNNEYAGWENHQIYQDLYNYGWSVFDHDFGTRIKSLKILL